LREIQVDSAEEERNSTLVFDCSKESLYLRSDIPKDCSHLSANQIEDLIAQEFSEDFRNQRNSQLLIDEVEEINLSEDDIKENKFQVGGLFPSPESTLSTRKKHQRLSFSEKLHVYK
jgi:hypothetical protein